MIAPTITVITVCYNAEAYIGDTIKSVLEQTFSAIEFIVVDGGSTDATGEIIALNLDRIAHYVSEPDEGIADAMNKGIALATGDLVIFLHADDYFERDDAVETAVRYMERDHNVDIFSFNILFSRAGQLELRRSRGFTWYFNFKTGLYHQGVFCRRTLFETIGGFDTGLRIATDYDFFLRAYRRGAVLRLIDRTVSVMRDTGISSRLDWPNLHARLNEEKKIHAMHCRNGLWRLVYWLYWLAYPSYRRIRTALAATSR